MDLKRIHAYEVVPQRLAGKATAPSGGAFKAPDDFVLQLDRYLVKSRLHQQPPVAFRASFENDEEGEVGANEVRDRVLEYTFGQPATAKSAAMFLASRLGMSMDDRSTSCLLVLTAYAKGAERRFVGWAFPKDEPFGFSAKGSRANIEIIKNAFSRSSKFRKAVLFEGLRDDETYWTGNVIDEKDKVANYWVTSFLECDFLINGKTGTQLLARVLRETHDSLASRDDKDQIAASILSVRASQRKSWSLSKFANEYLSGSVKSTFLSKAPPAAVSTSFPLDRAELETKAGLRVFKTEDGVTVMAPFDTINNSVKLTGQSQRKLKYEGIVTEEKVRAKSAR
ncbi:MAG: hypothetical protein KDB22_01155 [Planctomycetales bacterium]|nr:hypothetical protein [Planctomycetales bacterium]